MEDSSEDEEFYNEFQNDVQSTPVEERPTKKAKSVRPQKIQVFQIQRNTTEIMYTLSRSCPLRVPFS